MRYLSFSHSELLSAWIILNGVLHGPHDVCRYWSLQKKRRKLTWERLYWIFRIILIIQCNGWVVCTFSLPSQISSENNVCTKTAAGQISWESESQFLKKPQRNTWALIIPQMRTWWHHLRPVSSTWDVQILGWIFHLSKPKGIPWLYNGPLVSKPRLSAYYDVGAHCALSLLQYSLLDSLFQLDTQRCVSGIRYKNMQTRISCCQCNTAMSQRMSA